MVLVFIYEVYMFVHAIRNPGIAGNRKLLWLVGMVFIHPFVAIAYSLTDYSKAKI